MIFTTECPSCVTEFPIDSGKVPDDGVYARCSECEAVFLVENPPAPGDPQAPAGGAVGAEDDAAAVGLDPAPASFDAIDAEEAPGGGTAADADPWPVEQPAQADHTAVADPPRPAPAFGKRDPHERAARLARVLVSDMIAYHPDRHRRSLEAGTLPQDFEEEIQKSWDEYVDQVGKELAESTDFFRDALNQVLARGQQVF